MKNQIAFAGAVVIAIGCIGAMVGCNSSTSAEGDVRPPVEQVAARIASPESAKPGAGMTAMRKAAEEKKYLFAFFRKEEDSQTSAMRAVLEEAMKEVADRASSVEIDAGAASEKAIVDKFELDRAPMPLVLAIAPNGAITGGFPTEVQKQKLLDAFASPGMEACMKQLQDNKLVFLCVQNGATKLNDEALEGVNAFKADDRFGHATEIVMLNPTDAAEAALLKDLQVDPATETAVTVFLAPPGMPVAMYEGATSKDELVATLEKASAACGPSGCGPGGCGPSGCPPK